MATTKDFIEFACDQIDRKWCATYKKMFGEYMVYINQKPVLLVCDNVIYVKKITCVEKLKKNWDVGLPYPGAKEHFVLDIEDRDLVEQVIEDMLLSGLVSMAGYQRTLTSAGYHISHAEDVTSYTVKTWQDALSVTRKFSFFTGLGEIIMRPAISLKFLRAVLGMRREMLAGRIRSGIIVAEKSR